MSKLKLKEFLENLDKFVKDNPDALDMYVVTSGDDEGNQYNFVYYTPTIGYYDRGDKNFVSIHQYDEFGYKPNMNNSVCIN